MLFWCSAPWGADVRSSPLTGLATFRRKNEVRGCCGRIAQGMENCQYSTGNRGGANDCSRAARSYGAAIGDGLSSRAPPAEPYHPGTALADHRDIEESGDARAR